MQALFEWLLGAGRETALFVISMVPLVELRGAVPLGLGLGMHWGEVLPICYLGNLLPIPFLLLFGAKVLKWLEKLPVLSKFSLWYQAKLAAKSSQVTKYAHWGLFLFVAIPVPGTGAWSGAVIATLLHMRRGRAFLSIAAGVITAGVIMALGSSAVIGALSLF